VGVGIDKAGHEKVIWQVNHVSEAAASERGLRAYFLYAAAFDNKIARLVDVILGVKGDDLICAN
jgi:hypothetical protein